MVVKAVTGGSNQRKSNSMETHGMKRRGRREGGREGRTGGGGDFGKFS